jgi:hypothetical protein
MTGLRTLLAHAVALGDITCVMGSAKIDGLCKNVASNDVSFRRNLSLKEGVLHEDETI